MNRHTESSSWIRVIVVLGMLLGLILTMGPVTGLSQPAPSSVPTATDFWYYVDDQRVSLPLATDAVAVRFASGVDAPERAAIVETAENLAPLDEARQVPVPELTLLSIEEGTSEAELLETLGALRADPGIEFAYPLFAFGDDRMTLTDQFVARFRPDAGDAAVEALNAANGVEIVKEMRLPDTYLLSVGAASDTLAMANLYHESDLTSYATPDFVRLLTRKWAPNDTHYPNQWAMENTETNPPGGVGKEDADIDASAAWDISKGDPDVVIAIIDEGVELSHEDLNDKIVDDYSAIPDDPDGGNPNNTWDAHGTTCAGIAAAETNNAQGVAGVCPNCSLLAVQIAYTEVQGGGWITTDSGIAEAIVWSVDNGADVLSNSWGGGPSSSLINNAITHAVVDGRGGLGSVVLFAAGNDNMSPVDYPASNNDTIAVGATSPCDERKNPSSCDGEGWGSSYGDDLDVVAPGVQWWSTDLMGAAGRSPDNYDDDVNGTSSATPAAAGLAGLILSNKPCLTEAQVQEIMEQSADDQVGLDGEDTAGWDRYMGWGRINAYQALLLADGFHCAGPEPGQEPECQRILFDETHGWASDETTGDYTIEDGFSELAALLRDQGHFVDSLQDPAPFSYAILGQYDVLVLMLPQEDYSEDEKYAIAQFVNDGGRLVTIGDSGDVAGVSLDILNEVHGYLGDGLAHSPDTIYDPSDNQGGNALWPLIHNFPVASVNDGVSTVVEYAASSLDLSESAYGTAFGDDDLYTSVSAMEAENGGVGPDMTVAPGRVITQPASERSPDARTEPVQAGFSTPIYAPHSPVILLDEGFESGSVPPPGWIEVVSNINENWKTDTGDPHSGSYQASVSYDPAQIPQDEWLLSPELSISSGILSFWSYGSTFWCRDVHDNCDLNVWLVVGPGVNDGDDILLGTADDDWAADYVWSQSVFDLTPRLPSGPVRIGFQYEGLDGEKVSLDDILLTQIPIQAMADVGAGDVFAIGDANLWDNADRDGNEIISLFEYDNAQLAHNVFARGQVCSLPAPGCQRILFDETHGVRGDYTIGNNLGELAVALRGSGNGVDALQDPAPFEYATLSQYDVLVLTLPLIPYTTDEKDAIAQFVNDGGRLVTIGESGGWVEDSRDILNDVHAYLGDGLVHNNDTVYDLTDNDGDPYWPLVHTFSSDAVNEGLGTVVEYVASSLQASEPAYGTAFGDGDTYTVGSTMEVQGSGAGPHLPPRPERAIIQPPGEFAPDDRAAPSQVGFSTPIYTPSSLEILIDEGFESGHVPPLGWTAVISNPNGTWITDTISPHSGTYSAHVLYDPDLKPQDEWLLSPEVLLTEGTLSFWSYGFIDWCRGAQDNCDLNIWLVVGPNVNDGDDIYVGTADEDWHGSWTWSQSVFDLTPSLPDGPVRIGFQYLGQDGAEINLDDILLEGHREPVIVQAMASVGRGDVFAIGDVSLWSDEDPDDDGIPSFHEYDNARLAQNVFASGQGPRVYFDIYHDLDGASSNYTALADMVTDKMGGIFDVKDQLIDPAALQGYNLLVTAAPELAFAPSEMGAIADFVATGGRLVILGEEPGAANTDTLNALLARVGVDISLNDDRVYDPTDYDTYTYWPLIHLYRPNPLARGVDSTALYGSASLNAISPAVPIGSGDDDTDVEYPAATGSQGNTEAGSAGMAPTYTFPGRPIVMALSRAGRGDVFVVGDSDIWSDSYLSNYDNAQLARNVFAYCQECASRVFLPLILRNW